jgi:hypothetical protein
MLCCAGSTPVTVLVCRMGLRVDNKDSKLQERLHFLRDMMGVEHALFFTFEGEAESNVSWVQLQRSSLHERPV